MSHTPKARLPGRQSPCYTLNYGDGSNYFS